MTFTCTTTTKNVWNKRSLPIRKALTEFGRLPLDVIKLVEEYDKFEGDFDSSLPQRPSKESKKVSRGARAYDKHTAEEAKKARAPCKFFLRLLGGCRYGHSCRYFHDHAALKRRLLCRQNRREWKNLPDSLDCGVDLCRSIDSRRSNWDSVGEDMREEILRRREKKKKTGSNRAPDEWDFM